MIAYSNFSLKPWEFWDKLNPRDFVKMCEGFNLREKKQRLKELESQRLIRWVGYMNYAMHRDPKKRMLKPDEVYYLNEPKEEKQIKIPNKEDIERLKKMPFPRKLDDKDIYTAIKERKRDARGR